MRVDLFDFALPQSLIALRPAAPRDSARLLVVHADGRLEHAHVRDLPAYLVPGDALVLNDTAVIPARLHGHRLPRGPETAGPGSKVEILLHKNLGEGHYRAFARPARKLLAGDRLDFGAWLAAEVMERGEGGDCLLRFSLQGAAFDAALRARGEVPLPPYIASKRPVDARDASDYQTVFASQPGSVAAPTAGLHFTRELFAALQASGVACETVTLHVGAGTFLPVSAEDTVAHRMHGEWLSLSGETALRLNGFRDKGGRIIAVGTTSLRTLETAAGTDRRLQAFEGETDIFITPGYRFQACDVLLTNFHLPRSTLFMLVCAFAGLERMQAAYAAAITEQYRFYSYGDACLIFPPAS